jgi:uncharacterized protein (DUF1330 family)
MFPRVMSAYAIAHVRQVTMRSAIVEYLERIDATLAPFGNRFADARQARRGFSGSRNQSGAAAELRSVHLSPVR